MADGYEIVEHDTGAYGRLLVLRQDGGTDFLSKMHEDPKSIARYRAIVRMVAKVQAAGTIKFNKTLVRMLDSSLSLFELKVAGQVIRVMAHIGQRCGERAVVLLFDFNGHKNTSKIPKQTMKKGKRLAGIAMETLRECE